MPRVRPPRRRDIPGPGRVAAMEALLNRLAKIRRESPELLEIVLGGDDGPVAGNKAQLNRDAAWTILTRRRADLLRIATTGPRPEDRELVTTLCFTALGEMELRDGRS